MTPRSLRSLSLIVIVLALLLSSTSTTKLYAVQTAKPQVNNISTGRVTRSPATPGQNGMSWGANAPASTMIQPAWSIGCVDCPKQIWAADRSLRLDSAGHPHLAYGSSQLYYAWDDGTSWHYSIVDNDSPRSSISLVLDLHDNPRISYSTNGQLKYAEWISNTWNIQAIDSEATVHTYTSLALDRTGHPHIGYYDAINNDLKYAYWSGSGWITQTIDSYGWVGAFPSLALDTADRPHISYADFGPVGKSGSTLKYASWTGNSWDIQTIPGIASMGTYTSLVLDSTNRPHISCHNESYDKLMYVHWTGAAWDIQTLDGGGWSTSLALDAAGQPHITYMDHSSLSVKYAYWASNMWHFQTVSTGFVGWGSSLALDSVGQPHLSYLNYWNQEFTYTYWIGAAWNQHVVDIAGDAGEEHSLVLDTAGNPHISYYDSAKFDLNYAYWTGNRWNIQAVDTVGFVGQGNSLALDTANHPHIAYAGHAIAGNSDLKYAYWTGNSWNLETVDTGDCGLSSLALDGDGYAHISYACGGALKYARWTGSTWDIQTLDNDSLLFRSPSLTLDSAGNPHISYNPGTLKYAEWNGNAWNIQTVDIAYKFANTSLVLDSVGRPSISYANQGLKYAVWTGSVWDIQKLDNGLSEGFSSSLKLDKNDNPRISYNNGSHELRYARWSDGHWDIQTVDDDSNVVLSMALVLDSREVPFITYYDYDKGALRFAQLILPPLMLYKEATLTDGVRLDDVLTYTLTISAPAVSAQLWDPLPASVEYITDSLISTLTPTVIYSPTARAIMWQGILPTDTMPTISFQVASLVSATNGSSLSAPIANTAWLTDTDYDRHTWATAIVNGWHAYLPLILRQF